MPERRRPRGVTPRPRSGAAAERARLQRRRNGREELPRVQGQGRQPRVPGCDSAGAALRSYPTPEGRGGGQEESKEQWLRFAAAAVKTYPMSKVRENQARW